MHRRAFVAGMAATMFVPAARVGHARGSDEVRPLERLYAQTRALVLKYYPDAKTEVTKHTIHFEARTRRFMVHEPLKTGEWQDARETIGPQRGGVVGNMELRTGKYLGAAAVPQAFDKRYFTLQVMAPYSEARDVHLYTHLLYPADASKVFLSEFTDLVTRFAEYLRVPQLMRELRRPHKWVSPKARWGARRESTRGCPRRHPCRTSGTR